MCPFFKERKPVGAGDVGSSCWRAGSGSSWRVLQQVPFLSLTHRGQGLEPHPQRTALQCVADTKGSPGVGWGWGQEDLPSRSLSPSHPEDDKREGAQEVGRGRMGERSQSWRGFCNNSRQA